jgi:shikimate dehydrogenase
VTKRACVIGWPIEHSRSPLIHGHWLKKYGIDGTYTKEAVRTQDVRAFLLSLSERGLQGCNVTVPHKEAALAAAQDKDASALAVGAANTLWLEAGRLCAANTDTYGYMTHLTRSAPDWRRRDAPVCILGAGGAARAIVHGFLKAGAGEVRVFNRSRSRAEELARHFGSRVKPLDWANREHLSREAAVLVNTTTLGMKGDGSPDIGFTRFHPDCVVSDIVYVPLETEFLRAARLEGLKTVGGLGMLLHQAVPGFEKWFGVRPEVTTELFDLIVRDIEGR